MPLCFEVTCRDVSTCKGCYSWCMNIYYLLTNQHQESESVIQFPQSSFVCVCLCVCVCVLLVECWSILHLSNDLRSILTCMCLDFKFFWGGHHFDALLCVTEPQLCILKNTKIKWNGLLLCGCNFVSTTQVKTDIKLNHRPTSCYWCIEKMGSESH